MGALTARYHFLFRSTKGLILVAIALITLVTAIWGLISGPMAEFGVRDFVIRTFGMDIVEAEREGRIILLYHTIALAVVAPWATWKFSEKTDQALDATTELQQLYKEEKILADERRRRMQRSGRTRRPQPEDRRARDVGPVLRVVPEQIDLVTRALDWFTQALAG